MPLSLSQEAQDLLKCILNTDPLRRIRLSEIREHPWVLANMSYRDMVMEEWVIHLLPKDSEIDEDILKELMACKFPMTGQNKERIVEAILRKDSDDFVVAYWLKRDEKYRKKLSALTQTSLKSRNASLNNWLTKITQKLWFLKGLRYFGSALSV